MGTRIPERPTSKGEAFRLLAEDLRTATSAEKIQEYLRNLKNALIDGGATDNGALVFIRAGGLHTLIRLLRGIITSDWRSSSNMWISIDAANALNSLLLRTVGSAELATFTDVIPLLVQALWDAPNPVARGAAVQSLFLLADAEPAHCRTMAEAGVMMGLLSFLVMGNKEQAWVLVRALVRTRTVVGELKQAICEPCADQAFTALLIFQDSMTRAGGETLAAFGDGAMVDILVATLKHRSSFCVTVAAEALSSISQTPGGQTLIEASGAIPALVRVLGTQPRPVNLEEEASVFRRSIFEIEVGGEFETMHYNNSTAMAATALVQILKLGSDHTRESFVEAGGVPVLLQLLCKSTCPATLVHTAAVTSSLFLRKWGSTEYSTELADEVFQSGLCEAVIQTLRKEIKGTHGVLLNMLSMVITRLPDHSTSAAMAVLLTGGVVEFTVAYLANPGQEGIEWGLGLFYKFIMHPGGRERLCTPVVADQLIQWLVKRLSQADWPELSDISSLLATLLQECPSFVPTAIKANITPGLIRLLRKVHIGQASCEESLDSICKCLTRFLLYDKMNTMVWWKSAVDEGIVPVIMKWLTNAHGPTVVYFIRVAMMLLGNAPTGEVGQWGGELVRAIAGLLTSDPPVAPRDAAQTLSRVCMLHPELVVDCRTLGIGESLQQLTMHADPDTAAAARQLQRLLFCGNQNPDWTQHPAGRPATKPAASTSSPSPNPTHKQQAKAQGPKPPTPSSLTAAGTLKPPHRKPSSRHELSTGARARPDEAQLSDVPGPEVHGDRISRVGASPGRACRKDRACAGCGIMAEMVENGKLQECGACRSVRYCGKACQKAHWPAHKLTCKRMQATRQWQLCGLQALHHDNYARLSFCPASP